MSWSIVGSTTWFSNQTSGTPVTGSVVWPAGADQPGDVGIMTITARTNAAITVPADWTLLESRVSSLTGSTDAPSHYVYGFVRGAAAPSMAISIPMFNYCSLFCYRHSSGSAAISTVAKNLFDTAVTTFSADPGITGLGADSLFVLCAANGRNAAFSATGSVNQTTASGAIDTTSAPSGAWVERSDHGSTGTHAARAAIFDVVVNEGSTGTITTAINAAGKGSFVSVVLVGDGAPGDPPLGTTMIITIDPGETSAQVTYSYDDTDEDSYEYRLDAGTPASIGASPATITGLTASTEYDIEVRAINASGAGAWSAVSTFTTDAPSGDTTAPVLSSPTGAATGATTASGAVTTDEGSGTLYAVLTTSATPPSAADLRTGAGAAYSTNQPVAATGVQNVSATVLTPETSYYWHFLHDDAALNASNIATSAALTTEAVVGSVTISDPLKNNTGTVHASLTGVKVSVLQAADLASVLEAETMTDAAGLIPAIASAAITPGQNYHVAIRLTDGSVGITGAITAS